MQIVVCDPDGVSGNLLARFLKEGGYSVAVCQTAAACEMEVDAGPISLVVTALLIPDLDGLALARRLKARQPAPSVVMVSALQASVRALEVGVDAFLSKPVSPRGLLTTVQDLLSRGGLHE